MKTKTDVSEPIVIACGIFLEGYPRYDTEWEALSHLSSKQLIDLRMKLDININPIKRPSIFQTLYYAVKIINNTRKKNADIIFIFSGNFLLTIVIGLTKFLHRATVYYDLYTSAYLSVRTHTPGLFNEIKTFFLEYLTSHLSDGLICLTIEYANFYQATYKIRRDKLSVIYDGVPGIWLEYPGGQEQKSSDKKRVIYWGNYLIHHGLEIVLDAAEKLQNEPIEFVFCGRGRFETAMREEAEQKNLKNIVFKGFIPTIEELIDIVDTADVVLGTFKDYHDTKFSTSNKLKQGMARCKPVITVWTQQQENDYGTKDNPFPAIVQIESNAGALVNAIKDLINNPSKARQIGENARIAVEKMHSVPALIPQMAKALSFGRKR